jgi:hypothetical protein
MNNDFNSDSTLIWPIPWNACKHIEKTKIDFLKKLLMGAVAKY